MPLHLVQYLLGQLPHHRRDRSRGVLVGVGDAPAAAGAVLVQRHPVAVAHASRELEADAGRLGIAVQLEYRRPDVGVQPAQLQARRRD